jgi:hypothetical protein
MPKAQPLLLDLYPNAAVAYSLRKLRTAYSGMAIRVRRGVDNAEQDIGFDSLGNLDTEALLDFNGYNLWTYSEQIQQGVWTKTNTTVTADAVVAPDGLTTADIVYETVTNNTHGISRGQAVINGEDYCVSFYIKANGRDYFQLRAAINLSTNNLNTPIARFDLTTSSVIFDNGFFRIAPTITAVGSGWYKIEYGLIANSTTTSTALVIEFSTDGTTISYIGDVTKGMAIWGVQISQTSTIKPYQRTVAVAALTSFISVWYDQSGNGINAVQTTPSTIQATIVSNANVVIDPNNLRVSSLWTSSFYLYSSPVGAPSQTTISAFVFNRITINSRQASFGNTNVGGRPTYFYWDNTNDIRIALGTIIIDLLETNNLNIGSFLSINQRNSSNITSGYLNGVALPNTGVQAASTSPTAFGKMTSGVTATIGYIQEAIWWNQNYLSVRTDIEQNINDYYGIY